MLALTVTLFSAIFAFVTSFPSPPAQNTNQFQASLIMGSSGTSATGVAITHLAGPVVPPSALIYFKSAVHPGICPFTGPASLAQGGIASPSWYLGQTWSLNFTTFCGTPTVDTLPDNITIYIVSQSTVIFSVVLPGLQITTPPAITAIWVSPNPVSKGSAFVVHATIIGGVKSNSVYVNLAPIPGLPNTPVRMSLYQGQWIYNVSAPGATSPGSYIVFVNATGTNGDTTSSPLTIAVTASGGGLIVSVTATPTSGGIPLRVSFGATVSGANGSITYAWAFGNGATSTLVNPSTWYNTSGSYLATLTVTDSKGNQGASTVTISALSPAQLISGIAWMSPSAVSQFNCYYYGTGCPAPMWQVWDNSSVQVSVSGRYYANISGHAKYWTIGATAISAGSNSGAMDAGGAGYTWYYPPYTGTYTLTLVLTVTNAGTSAFITLLTYTISGMNVS